MDNMGLIGRKVAVMRLCERGNEPTKDDIKYTGQALNKVVEIKHVFEDFLFLTDFFMPEYVKDKNDYCHYGFLVLDRSNFNLIEGC